MGLNKLKFTTVMLWVLLFVSLVLAIHTTDVIPNLNATYDLGNSTQMYRDLWLSRNAYIGGNTEIGGTLSVTGISTFSGNSTFLDFFNAIKDINAGADINLNSSIKSQHSGTYMYYDESGPLIVHIEE